MYIYIPCDVALYGSIQHFLFSYVYVYVNINVYLFSMAGWGVNMVVSAVASTHNFTSTIFLSKCVNTNTNANFFSTIHTIRRRERYILRMMMITVSVGVVCVSGGGTLDVVKTKEEDPSTPSLLLLLLSLMLLLLLKKQSSLMFLIHRRISNVRWCTRCLWKNHDRRLVIVVFIIIFSYYPYHNNTVVAHVVHVDYYKQ